MRVPYPLPHDGTMCLSETFLKHAVKCKPKLKVFNVFHDKLGFIGKSSVFVVNLESHGRFFADVRTGTLYHIDTLHSYNNALYLEEVCKSQEQGQSSLQFLLC